MDADYRRGRSGRPAARLRAWLKREGTNICWLCAKPIDLSLHHTHPDSWTMDHIKPLSLFPELALERSNVREAHRSCNSKRGTGNRVNKGRVSRDW